MFKEIIIHATAQGVEGRGHNARSMSVNLLPIHFSANTEQPLGQQVVEELASRLEIRNRHHPTVELANPIIDHVIIDENGEYILLNADNLDWPEPEDEQSARAIMQM